MSADNGHYILDCPSADGKAREYRVAHAMAIENIYWWPLPGKFFKSGHPASEERNEICPEVLVEYFGRAVVISDKAGALLKASEMEDECLSSCGFGSEYGISFIKYDKPFPVAQPQTTP